MGDLEERHNKALEEVLSQLDLVEKEHKIEVAEKAALVNEQHDTVDDLMSQLKQAEARAAAADDIASKLSSELERTEGVFADLDELKRELYSFKDMHSRYVVEVEEQREKACEEAREEMIERAEVQFKQANELYVKLKKQYDAAKSKIEKLETEAKRFKEKHTSMSMNNEAREVELCAEVAKLRAEHAKIEADNAQKAKEYRAEMERLLQATKDFEIMRDDALKRSHSLQNTLDSVIAEKDKLKREYDEVQSVCEELMTMVESPGRQRR